MTDNDVLDAIAEGVDRAITRMITGVTDMPSTDFWHTLKQSIETAFARVAEDTIERHKDQVD